ncbi:lipase 3 [Pieris rapae]|uniref:lipase 3 n=1 Tax=Pieris rapae TaxID=64459 RepID=UPI001E27F7B9|nr:lipase 3 [Pieris rapae]
MKMANSKQKYFLIISILLCVLEHEAKCENDIYSNLIDNPIFKKLAIKDHESTLESQLKQSAQLWSQSISNQNEDISLNITQLIKKNNFPVEEYTVTTSDGYELKLFRIPGNGPVVFLMHGALCSADDWISPGVDSGIGFLLAAQGYDVWMGNNRGNKYSRMNINISPSDKKFWDYSFHEIGYYDLPAMIDFVLEKTSKPSLTFVGHSQGTSVFYVLTSLRPEYNQKVNLMLALSSVAWMSNVVSPPIRLVGLLNKQLESVSSALGINELLGDTPTLRFLQRVFCGDNLTAFIFCQHFTAILGGFNYNQTNYENLPVIYNKFPAGASVKQFVHYGQLVESGEFRQYDYGIRNIEKYGSLAPPSYPVEKITTPIAILYSNGDWLASLTDILIFISKLPNLADFYFIPENDFSHFDFIYGKDTKGVVLPRMLRMINMYGQ